MSRVKRQTIPLMKGPDSDHMCFRFNRKQQVMPLYRDPQEAVDAKLKEIQTLPPDPYPLSEYKHPVTAKPSSLDNLDPDYIKPPQTGPVPDLRRPGVPAVDVAPRPSAPPHPPVQARAQKISILSERCDLLIGEMVKQSRHIPEAHERLQRMLGGTFVAKYESSADSLWKSVNAGKTPQVLVGDSLKEVDRSTEKILKTAAQDDDSLLKALIQDFSRIR